MLSVKDQSREVAGLSVTDRIKLPAVSVVPAHKQGAIASACPDRAILIPGHIHVAIAIGDRDDGFTPAFQIIGLFHQPDLSTAGKHPETSIRLVANALQSLATHPLMDSPNGISSIPGGLVDVMEPQSIYKIRSITSV